MKNLSLIAFCLLLACCTAQPKKATPPSEPELHRISYTSSLDGAEREYYLYLPKGYRNDTTKAWPVLMHLHGNGERGDGKKDLIWLTKHGPLMEAWVQKKDLPFIMIVPQLHMLGMDTLKAYIANRDTNTIPRRQIEGVPARIPVDTNFRYVKGPKTSSLPYPKEGNIRGWYMVEDDLLSMVQEIQNNYRGDIQRTYLTGLSYGGFGTWYMASAHPNTFAAIMPVCGWGHPDLMPSIAEQNIPIWCFAGERDMIILTQHFDWGFEKLDELNYANYTYSVVPKVGHDVWKKVYQDPKVYQWLLKQRLDD